MQHAGSQVKNVFQEGCDQKSDKLSNGDGELTAGFHNVKVTSHLVKSSVDGVVGEKPGCIDSKQS